MLAWRDTVFVTFVHRIGFRMSELFRKIDEDFSGSISWHTQPNRHVLFKIATALLSPFKKTFFLAVLQPGDAHWGTYPPICTHSQTCRTGILADAIFHRMNCCKFLARQSKHSSAGTLTYGTSGSRCISHTLPRRSSRRRIRLCRFCTLLDIVTETPIVSFHTLPVGFPLPTISKNSLSTLFCPLILDHGVLLKISASGSKVLISNFLLDTSFHQSFQSVIIRS